MKFDEIFNNRGYYITSDLAQGFAYFVTKNKELVMIEYYDRYSSIPIIHDVTVSEELLQKEFIKIDNRHDLFKPK